MSTNDSEIFVRLATNDDCENVQNLVFGILRDFDLEPAPEGLDKDIGDIEAHYINRGGTFEILEDEDGAIVGTVGLNPFDDERIELRKRYFSEDISRKGLGKETLQRMIKFAKANGYKQIVLETASVLEAAIGLYKEFGFIETRDKHAARCDQAFYLDL